MEHIVSTMLQVISFAFLDKHVFQIGFKLAQLLQAQCIESIFIRQITSSCCWKIDKVKGRCCWENELVLPGKKSSSIFCSSMSFSSQRLGQ